MEKRGKTLTAVATEAICLNPENTRAVLFTRVNWTRCPPVTLAKGADSKVDWNIGVVENDEEGILPSKTWYWRTPDKARGFRVSSAERGLRAIRLAKAELEGARMVMFDVVERV